MKIYNVTDPEFAKYGKIIDNVDFSKLESNINLWVKRYIEGDKFMKLKLDYVLNRANYKKYEGLVKKVNQMINEKTGEGNDFLGWTTWPKDYDKEEFERIKAKAKYVRENFDVLVVCGYVAMNEIGEITTLGRGGSDYTAVLIAKMLGIDEVEIYTDVDGIYDSDPKFNIHAKRYHEISYHHMLALKSRVLNDKCVEYAQENKIRIHLKSTFSNEKGTIVS